MTWDKKKRLSGRFISILALIIMLCSTGPSYADSSETVYHETEEEAAAELREQMLKRKTKVTVGFKAEPDQDELKAMIGRLVDEATEHTGNPDEGDYITFQYESFKGMAQTGALDYEPVVTIEYDLSYYDNKRQEKEADKKANEIIESLELEDKTDYEKIQSIYDYICDNVDYEPAEDGDNINRTAYGALVGGKAVCQGYTVALYKLLLMEGIDNRIIFGKGVSPEGKKSPHTWNIVRLEDKYYYIDPTWGDTADRKEYFLVPAGAGFEDAHIADEEFADESFTEKYPMAEEKYSPERSAFMQRAASLASRIAAGIHNIFVNDEDQ